MQTIAGITALLVPTSPQAVTSLPAPALTTDGVDITSWRVGKTQPVNYDIGTVYIAATGAATLTNPVYLWGYRNVAWWKLGVLNNSADVAIVGAGQGFAQRIDEVGIFSRLAISCASITGGGVTYSYYFEPIALRND